MFAIPIDFDSVSPSALRKVNQPCLAEVSMLRAIVVAALVMLTCVGPLNAQSQPPPSTPTVIGDPQQEESTFRDEPAAPKEREPEVRPPAIETAPTPDAAPNTPQKHEKHEEDHYVPFTGLDPDALMAVMEDEERKLWLYGYVDYRDRFGTRHRGGYMRRYERFDRTAAPDALGHLPERYNNLVFDPTPGFNYDRERERGEGNDWNEN